MVLLFLALGVAWFSVVLVVVALCRAAATDQPLVGLWTRVRRRRAAIKGSETATQPDFPAPTKAPLHSA